MHCPVEITPFGTCVLVQETARVPHVLQHFVCSLNLINVWASNGKGQQEPADCPGASRFCRFVSLTQSSQFESSEATSLQPDGRLAPSQATPPPIPGGLRVRRHEYTSILKPQVSFNYADKCRSGRDGRRAGLISRGGRSCYYRRVLCPPLDSWGQGGRAGGGPQKSEVKQLIHSCPHGALIL